MQFKDRSWLENGKTEVVRQDETENEWERDLEVGMVQKLFSQQNGLWSDSDCRI